jgi:hypothetical protein
MPRDVSQSQILVSSRSIRRETVAAAGKHDDRNARVVRLERMDGHRRSTHVVCAQPPIPSQGRADRLGLRIGERIGHLARPDRHLDVAGRELPDLSGCDRRAIQSANAKHPPFRFQLRTLNLPSAAI